MSSCTKRAVAVPCARSSPRRSYPRRCTSCRSTSRSDHQPCSKSIVSFTAEEVVQATGGQLAHLPSAHHGTSGKICTDTREPMRGAWFVALAGENFDGVAFAEQARDRGCLGVVAPAKPPSDWQGAAWIVCPSTGRDALGALGRAARRRLPPQCPVVAVTGSAGKTTTRELAALMLTGGLGDVHATKGNLNNDVGVPKTLLDLPDAGTRAVVLEMGMSAPGEIETLAAVGEPNVRIVTNVALAHAATCGGTLAGVAACKAELINTARDGDHVVLNADDSHVAAMAQLARQNGATVWYFCRDGCDRNNTNAATTQRRTVTWTEPHVADAQLSVFPFHVPPMLLPPSRLLSSASLLARSQAAHYCWMIATTRTRRRCKQRSRQQEPLRTPALHHVASSCCSAICSSSGQGKILLTKMFFVPPSMLRSLATLWESVVSDLRVRWRADKRARRLLMVSLCFLRCRVLRRWDMQQLHSSTMAMPSCSLRAVGARVWKTQLDHYHDNFGIYF